MKKAKTKLFFILLALWDWALGRRAFYTNWTLREDRLRVRNDLLSFVRYCSAYTTRYCLDPIYTAEDFEAKLHDFTKTIREVDTVAIPALNEYSNNVIENAFNLQLFHQLFIADDNVATLDEVDKISDWFSEQTTVIKALCDPYLRIRC